MQTAPNHDSAGPATGSAGPDINIPPPNTPTPNTPMPAVPSGPPVAPAPSHTMAVTPSSGNGFDAPPAAMSSTHLVITVVLILLWAGLLLFIKRLLTQSLIAQFADLGRSRAAGTTLYLFLLVLGATVIVCVLGGFWQVLEIIVPALVLNLVLLILFLVSLMSARASRQRR